MLLRQTAFLAFQVIRFSLGMAISVGDTAQCGRVTCRRAVARSVYMGPGYGCSNGYITPAGICI